MSREQEKESDLFKHSQELTKNKIREHMVVYTKWLNYVLKGTGIELKDFEKEIKDGVALVKMSEILTGKQVKKFNKTVKSIHQSRENIKIALDNLKNNGFQKQVSTVSEEDFEKDENDDDTRVDAVNVLGFLWQLMQNYSKHNFSKEDTEDVEVKGLSKEEKFQKHLEKYMERKEHAPKVEEKKPEVKKEEPKKEEPKKEEPKKEEPKKEEPKVEAPKVEDDEEEVVESSTSKVHSAKATESDEAPTLEQNEFSGDAGNDNNAGAQSKQSKSEKKARKAIAKLGLKPVKDIFKVSFKRSKNAEIYAISNPDVFKSKKDAYVVFGVMRVEDANQFGQEMQRAAQQLKPEGGDEMPNLDGGDNNPPELEDNVEVEVSDKKPVATEEVKGGDDEGVAEKDIELVLQQVKCSRSAAVAALKKHNGDIVNAIMELQF